MFAYSDRSSGANRESIGVRAAMTRGARNATTFPVVSGPGVLRDELARDRP